MVYLRDVRHASENTQLSYRHDLTRFEQFLSKEAVTDVAQIQNTHLQAYISSLEEAHLKAATISRHIASVKAFFHYLTENNEVLADIAEGMTAPKIEKQMPETLNEKEVERLLMQPSGEKPKDLRDKAMLELMYATGVRVTELITLKVSDVNLQAGYIDCGNGGKERKIPFGQRAAASLFRYLYMGRQSLLGNHDCEEMFVNCSGQPMSRQGFWKLLKAYAAKANIQKEITPHMLRHSFAVHMVQSGADIKSLQEMMGHSDIATTQLYVQAGRKRIREVYTAAQTRA